ncbi:MAG: TonB-dependent receptor [Acidobacteriota bacterium]
MRQTIPLLVVLSVSVWLAAAQVLPVGTVDGTIRDSSGALVPAAKITLANRDTGQSRAAQTNDAGYYFFPLVQPGRYQVSAEKAGFKKGVQELLVETGKRATVDLSLEVGQVTETVRVSGQAPLLETSSAVVSRNIQQRQVQDLPLLGRNPLKLMLLTAGVTANTTNNSNLLDVSGTSYVSTNGANNRQNEFLLDGIPNNISDRVNYIPPVDVVEEFSIQTNALDAEYGHGGGAYINITSKSGTNEWHGQAYDFVQNDKLNANNFFNNRAGVKRAPFRYNQFGAAAGGPIVKNKAFWFFNWESVRQRNPATRFFTAPTGLQRQGDLSQTFDRTGRLMEIYDPFSTRPGAGGAFVRDPFPGNRIPANRMDPIARNVMPGFPQPDGPGDPGSGTNNLITNISAPFDSDAYSVRVDPNIQKHRLFARWSRNKSLQGQPQPYDIGGFEGVNRVQTSVGLSDAYTLSPAMVITAQAGYSRWTQEGIHPSFDLAGMGFPAPLIAQMQQTIFPRFTNQDLMFIGASEGNWFEHTNTFSFQTGVTRISGRHNIKSGFQMQIKQNNSVPARSPSGSYSFNRAFTQGPDPNRVGTNVGNGIASFLLGTASGGTLDLRAFNATQAPYYSWYFQDDFKVTTKLTLNLGLRYELTLGTTERYDRNVFGLDRTSPNPIEEAARAAYARSPIPELAAADFKARGGLLFVGKDNRGNAITDKNNWAPRLGVAYRLASRTVLRGGLGLFYSYWWQPFVRQDGFASETSMVNTLDGGRTPADLLRSPFPQGLVQPIGASLGLRTLLGQNIQSYDQYRRAIRNTRWSFGIQQEIGPNLMVEANYVGQRGGVLPVATGTGDDVRNINFLPERFLALGSRLQDSVANPFMNLIPTGALSRPTVARRQLLLQYPHFGDVNLQRESTGRSFYHSLQLGANRRLSTGLSVQATYTWSKLIEQLRYIEASDPGPSRMIGEFDNPHRVTMAAIYELPFGPGKPLAPASPVLSRLAGGWQISAIYIYQTGRALFLPAALATGTSPKIPNPTIDRWINPDAMRILPPFTARRIPWTWNDLRQHDMNNWDISILKNTSLHQERVKLQFRCEMINAFNRTWFGGPDVNPASGSYTRVLGQANQPRNIQLALKLTF